MDGERPFVGEGFAAITDVLKVESPPMVKRRGGLLELGDTPDD